MAEKMLGLHIWIKYFILFLVTFNIGKKKYIV